MARKPEPWQLDLSPAMTASVANNPAQQVRQRLSGFIQTLKQHGFDISASNIQLAHELACTPLLQSHRTLRTALRAVFCNSKRDWDLFINLFNQYWFGSAVEEDIEHNGQTGHQTDGGTAAGLGYFSETQALRATTTIDPAEVETTAGGASDARVLGQRDFRFVFNPKEMRSIEFLVDSLARRVQKRARRRTIANRKIGPLDSRRTARACCQYGGWPFKLHHRSKRKTPPRFLLLLDVSQSMEIYSYLFLRFARGLMQAFSDIDAYAFHTDLVPIGNELRDKNIARLEQKLKNLSSGWLGGTRIAESLREFNQQHASQTVNRNTIVLIFSDGYDSSEPEELVRQITAIKARCRKLVWVNPLLGRSTGDDTVLAVDKCIVAVQPHLDLYTSAHNLKTLNDLAPAFSLR